MSSIDLPPLRRLLDDGAQLVEVLPTAEYAEMHLAGELNIPLKSLDAMVPQTRRRPRLLVGPIRASPRFWHRVWDA